MNPDRYQDNHQAFYSIKYLMQDQELIHQMAIDFAEFFNDLLSCNDPADEYNTPIICLFGSHPTRESVVSDWQDKEKMIELSDSLRSYCETELINPDIVSKLVERTLLNNFGPNFLHESP